MYVLRILRYLQFNKNPFDEPLHMTPTINSLSRDSTAIDIHCVLNQTDFRTPRVRIIIQEGCVVCGTKKCLDEKKPCIVTRTTTRRMSKLLQEISNIIIYETYRCMPLLGGEIDNAPGWEEHIVRYTVVFVKNNKSI